MDHIINSYNSYAKLNIWHTFQLNLPGKLIAVMYYDLYFQGFYSICIDFED